jgi:hypothetical protein
MLLVCVGEAGGGATLMLTDRWARSSVTETGGFDEAWRPAK